MVGYDRQASMPKMKERRQQEKRMPTEIDLHLHDSFHYKTVAIGRRGGFSYTESRRGENRIVFGEESDRVAQLDYMERMPALSIQ